MSDGSLLDRLQLQVADRESVDWDALAPALQQSQTLSAADVQEIALLRTLDEIAEVNAALQTKPFDALATGPFEPFVQPTTEDDTLESWGRYRLDEKVGRGGFGSVYRAWDPVLEMPVAIKILHRRFSDDHLTERLLREGRALAQVKHPNIVRVLNVEQNDQRLGLVMEFLRGETIDAMVAAQGMLNEREATVIAEDVCRALAAVHANKLIHRDVKARNIIRERAGRIVLMDFGAGLSEGAGPDEAAAAGTPLYMAPEVLRGAPATVASDVYSVGVLLFFLVTRRYPFEGGTVDDIRAAQASGAGHSLMALRPDLPLSFVRVVERALAVDLRDRYATPASLLQALLDVRDAGPNWKRLLARTALAVAALGVLLTLAGMLSSAAFNATLGRRDYATESVADWFALGRRSLLMPLVLSLLSAGVVGLIVATRKVLVTSSSFVRRIDRAMAARCGAIADRLSLNDYGVCSCWLVLLTALGAIAVWVYWAPLLRAISSDVATAPGETLAILSPLPAFGVYRTNYRLVLSVLAAANLAGWYALARAAAARGTRLPQWLKTTEIAALVLLYGSMQIPYRLIHDNGIFPSVTWGTEHCYVLGERADDTLLFCPKMRRRNHVVHRSTDQLEALDARESLFASFTPSVPQGSAVSH